MKNLILLFTIILFIANLNINAQITSASDHLIAQPLSPTVVKFNPIEMGISRPMLWGVDAGGWTNPVIWEKSNRYMGPENIQITRIPAMADGELEGGTQLRQEQKDWIKERIDHVAISGELLQVMLNPGAGDDGDAWYRADYSRYALLMKLAKDYIESFGHTVVSITGHNEPDVWYAPATMQMNNALFSACINSGYFDNTMRYCGANTLDPDFALAWYNYSIAYVNEGNTHQLAGTFDSYANFYTTVTNSGHYRTNDEIHNIMEGIVGYEYGMDAAIYWPDYYHGCNLARGEFTKATTNGNRLGYGEHRFNWTAGAVYKTGDKIQGFAGGSERQATTTNFSYISEEIPVFSDGQGPYNQYVMTLPGGNGYGVDQPNSERVIRITYGEDTQPQTTGNFVLVNKASGQVLTVASNTNGANVSQSAYSPGSNSQRWQVSQLPINSYGADANYYQLKPLSGLTRVLDVNTGSWDNNANIIIWDNGNASNQQWYIEYVSDGYFNIRSKERTYFLTTSGTNVIQYQETGADAQLWRLVPTSITSIEFVAPTAPTNLMATSKVISVQLDWTASPESDLAGYTILRSSTASGPYYTIANKVQTTSFLDNTVIPGQTYYYAVRADDLMLNKSDKSNVVSGNAIGGDVLVAQYDFEGNALDSSVNLYNASVYNTGTYTSGHIGTSAISLNGSNQFVQLPYDVAHSEQITVATWVKWDGAGAGNWQRIFDFGNGENEYMMLTTNRDGGGMRFAITNNSWLAEQGFNVSQLPTGVWKHVALTLGTTSAKLYVDGALVGQTNVSLSPADFTPMKNYIGGSQWIGDAYFDGSFDDFRIYNYELSQSEIQALASTLSAEDFELSSLSIWPIPARDVLHITSSENNLSEYTIYDVNGRTIMSKAFTASNKEDLNISEIPSGIYFLKITSNTQQTLVKKIVIQN